MLVDNTDGIINIPKLDDGVVIQLCTMFVTFDDKRVPADMFAVFTKVAESVMV